MGIIFYLSLTTLSNCVFASLHSFYSSIYLYLTATRSANQFNKRLVYFYFR